MHKDNMDILDNRHMGNMRTLDSMLMGNNDHANNHNKPYWKSFLNLKYESVGLITFG